MNLALRSGEHELSPDDIAGWQARYPLKDIHREFALMHLWLQRNKSRRPVQPYRFIDSWLKRADDLIVPKMRLVAGWWTTDERTINFAAGLNPPMAAKPGESFAEFRGRINARIGRAA